MAQYDNFEESGYVPEKIARAEKNIASNPYDIESWNVLVRDAQGKRIEDARQFYERLIGQFPNSGRFWKLYIEHEIKAKCYDKVEKLFQRCLMKVYHIDIWKQYLGYIKETKVNLPAYREKMAQAYDFALDKIGMEVNSYQIWVEFIAFLKSAEAVGTYAENQKITAMRKVYQKGVLNPMVNIDLFWKDYCVFENNINPLIAKKMQEDRSRDYTNAKRVAKEYEAMTKGINKNAPAIPPRNTPEEARQVELWKRYIQWEKSNPMRTEDQAVITKRVMFAYEQCLLCLGLHPDIWIEAASFLEQSSKLLSEKGVDATGKVYADEAAGMYERALSTGLKNCLLIYFAYADFEESRMKYDKVHSIYKRAIELQDVEATLVYVQYMRFARRAEGIKSARVIFKTAREDPRTKYHVYITAALMEHYCSKDGSIALKIFELAFKKFGSQIEFVREFIDYMSHLNEDNNTRVLFERILTGGQIPIDKSLEIWNKFVEFEANVGDLTSILKLEKRRLQAFGSEFEGKETSLVIDRYKFLDLLPCNSQELKSMGFKEHSKPQPCSFVASMTSSNNDPTVDPYSSNNLEEGLKSQKKSKIAIPDTAQMIPFKPKVSSHVLGYPGGTFAPPAAAADLLRILPPPSSFHGPFIKIDQFMENFVNLKLPDEYIPSALDLKINSGTLFSVNFARKKKALDVNSCGPADDGSDDEDSANQPGGPPPNDIFRRRQQKKPKLDKL